MLQDIKNKNIIKKFEEKIFYDLSNYIQKKICLESKKEQKIKRNSD